MSELVTIRWEDGGLLRTPRELIGQSRFDPAEDCLEFRWVSGFVNCPDIPENREALGLAKKEERVPVAFCEWCGRNFCAGDVVAISSPIEQPKCNNCGGRICPINPPPAREVVELEGEFWPIRFFGDRASVSVNDRFLIIRGISSTVPDTPRNRWLLRQAGIEVKE